jgi:hypothetical protein
MWKTDNLGTQVTRRRSEDAVEWFAEGGIIFKEASKLRHIVAMKLGCAGLENS